MIEVTEESGRDCADALAASVLEQRKVAATRMALVAQWADTHPPESITGSTTRWRSAIHDPGLGVPSGTDAGAAVRRTLVRGRSRAVAVQVGADGTPLVSEWAIVELGVLLHMTTASAQGLLRDVLDLRHRLPRVW